MKRGVRKVVYTERRWEVLEELRAEAVDLLGVLEKNGIRGVVVGSVARGDVHFGSDIDVFVGSGTRYFELENVLLDNGYRIMEVRVVRATPLSGLNIVYYLGARVHVVLRAEVRGLEEEEFTRYAGSLDLNGLRGGRRVPGVNKQLLFIEPTSYGHLEWSIIGNEREAASRLGISLRTVMSRVEHRLRRYRGGRRGLFVDLRVPYGDHVSVIARLLGGAR